MCGILSPLLQRGEEGAVAVPSLCAQSGSVQSASARRCVKAAAFQNQQPPVPWVGVWGVQGSTEPAPCQGQPQRPKPVLWGLPRATAGIFFFSPSPNISLGRGSAARVLWAQGEAGSPPNEGHGGVWGSWGAPGMGLLVPGWCQAPTHPRGWLVLQAGLSPAPCTVPNPAWGCSSTSHPPLAAFHTWPQRSPRGASREPGTARPRAASAVGAHVAPQGQPGTVGALPGAPPASPRAGPSWLGWGCHGLGQAAGQSLGAVPAMNPGIWEWGGSLSLSFVPGSVSPPGWGWETGTFWGRWQGQEMGSRLLKLPPGLEGKHRGCCGAGGGGGREAAQPLGPKDGAGSCSRAGKCGGHSVTKQTSQKEAVV